MQNYMEKVIIRLLSDSDTRIECARIVNQSLELGWKVKDVKMNHGGSSNYITAIFILYKEEPKNVESE